MTIFDEIYKWAGTQRSPATTIHSQNCIGHIHEDFVGYVVQISRTYLGGEIFASKRFWNFESARSFAVQMTEAISKLRKANAVSPISSDLVVTCYRLRFFQKIRTLFFPLTTKFYY